MKTGHCPRPIVTSWSTESQPRKKQRAGACRSLRRKARHVGQGWRYTIPPVDTLGDGLADAVRASLAGDLVRLIDSL